MFSRDVYFTPRGTLDDSKICIQYKQYFIISDTEHLEQVNADGRKIIMNVGFLDQSFPLPYPNGTTRTSSS